MDRIIAMWPETSAAQKRRVPITGASCEMAPRDVRSARRLVPGRRSQFVSLEWRRGKDLTSDIEARPCQVSL